MARIFLFLLIVFEAGLASAEVVVRSSNGALHRVDVKNWKEIRDGGVVKQEYDFSCGAASMATLLRGAYGVVVSEAELLETMGKQDGRASFEDMATIFEKLGFYARGYISTFSQLSKIKIPVILYVKHRRYDHFTVLRGIDENTVWLADPSVGNQTLSRTQFLSMWETVDLEGNNAPPRGKLLVILPMESSVSISPSFFHSNPTRRSRPAMLQLPLASYR